MNFQPRAAEPVISGKSTTVIPIAGIDLPTAGIVTLAGRRAL
jgi:ABC-type sulfate/molybdate transport systems ATPase subunit